MNLLVDVGNTLTKIALYDRGVIFLKKNYELLCVSDIVTLCDSYDIKIVAVSSVKDISVDFDAYLKERFGDKYLFFSYDTPIPIKNNYSTPKTLGNDRLLDAIAANEIFPSRNILVIDLGSAITVDFVNSDGCFMGGCISPGAKLRFKSLNMFTDKLPLCNICDKTSLFGMDTNSAIEFGVLNSIIYEIDSYIDSYRSIYGDIEIILTGGDSKYFENKLKNTIFADRDLIFKGLNRVIEYNEL